MKNFDTQRDARLKGDRTFKIGGETFTYRAAVTPESLIAWADMSPETPELDAIRIIDETVTAFLAPGQEAKWAAVRSPDLENPLTAGDIIEVIRWLVEEQVARPTSPDSGSSNGSETPTSGTASTVATSSEAAQVSAG